MSDRPRSAHIPQQVSPGSGCPGWCVTDHGALEGEEGLVHLGAPIRVARGVLARLVVSADPFTGTLTETQVLVGEDLYTRAAAATLGRRLTALAQGRPAAGGS